jgi:hypothetical protein
MLARAQRWIVMAWVCAALGWLLWFWGRGDTAFAVAGAMVIAGGHAFVLAVEFAMLPWINRRDPAPAADAAMLVRAWWSEVCASTRVFGWEQPWRSELVPDHVPPAARGRRGVVLVHGFVCNRGFWNPWLRRLRGAGIPFVAVNLEPVLGSIGRYAAIVDEAVSRLCDATGEPPVLVAHSMGGLAVRTWLREFDGDDRVHSVITIGTPHSGTWLARFGFAHNAMEMRQRCEWIETLGVREAPQRRRKFTCFYSHCDNIACPASTGTLVGADNRHVAGAAHVALAFRPEVFQALWDRVADREAVGRPAAG